MSLVLIFVVNRQSFHWSMTLHVPWASLGVLGDRVARARRADHARERASARWAATSIRAVKEDW